MSLKVLAALLLCSQLAMGMDMDMGMGSMGGEVQPSTNMDSPCYADPSLEECASFRRAEVDAIADRTSLCNAMGFMVGCSLMSLCESDARANMTFGEVYCNPWSQVADLCIDMGRMKGCEAWNALCGPSAANSSVVEMCTNPGPVPNVLTTMEAKDAIIALCTGPSALSGCAYVDMNTTSTWGYTDDYLLTLAALCAEAGSGNENCAGLELMCSGEGVAETFPEVCNSEAVPALGQSTGMGGMDMGDDHDMGDMDMGDDDHAHHH